jgi:hypothetical protein
MQVFVFVARGVTGGVSHGGAESDCAPPLAPALPRRWSKMAFTADVRLRQVSSLPPAQCSSILAD